MVLDASLLSTQHYKVRIKGKVEQSRKGVAPSPTHWCSSYRKGSLRVTLDYGRQLYLLYIYHHHHVVPLAQISLTLSRHLSLSFIASGRSSGLHPVPSYSCCMYARAGRPAFARPYVGVHRSTSLMSSSLLLQHAWFIYLGHYMYIYIYCHPQTYCFIVSQLFSVA